MKEILAVKTNQQKMIQVTGIELTGLLEEFPHISVGQFDRENTDFTSESTVGYVAGTVQGPKEEPVRDAWFVSKEFFDENYMRVI